MNYQPTSRLAWNETKKKLTESQLEVLAVLQEKSDQTNAEIAQRLGWAINRVTGRTLELRKLGKVRLLKHRKCSITGSTAMAWEPTEPATQLTIY